MGGECEVVLPKLKKRSKKRRIAHLREKKRAREGEEQRADDDPKPETFYEDLQSELNAVKASLERVASVARSASGPQQVHGFLILSSEMLGASMRFMQDSLHMTQTITQLQDFNDFASVKGTANMILSSSMTFIQLATTTGHVLDAATLRAGELIAFVAKAAEVIEKRKDAVGYEADDEETQGEDGSETEEVETGEGGTERGGETED